ncbi:MAG: hypothetical protein Q8Q15_01265, partial [bacterium]|nr:hypothetical protein [bacterium]
MRLLQIFVFSVFLAFLFILSPFNVKSAQAACNFRFDPPNPPTIQSVNIYGDNPFALGAFLWVNGNNIGWVGGGSFSANIAADKLRGGSNRVWLNDQLVGGTNLCTTNFFVGGGGGPVYEPEPCARDGVDGINTAIGCIPTTQGGFAGFFLKYSLGLGGVVAFFLIIAAGFIILTSSGNP